MRTSSLYTSKPRQLRKDATIKLMSDVEFIEQNEFHVKSRKLFGEPTTPTMISFLMRTGIVKNEKQAVGVLLILIVTTLFLTFYLNFHEPKVDNTVTDRYGISYTFEEYIELVKQGNDPLLPK